MKPKLFFTILLSFGLILRVIASSEYDWDGSSSSNWNTQANWSPLAGTQAQQQVYNVGPPATWDAPNAPVISANNVWTIDGIQVFGGGTLNITGGTTTIDDDLYIFNGGKLTISGGTLNVDNIYMIDANSELNVTGGTLIASGDIYLGRESPDNAENNPNGVPTLNITSGFVRCARLRYEDAEGDSPATIISGGELEITTAIQSDGADVDIFMSGGLLDINGNLNMTGGDDMLTMSAGQLTLTGSWNNSGSTNLSGGTITLDGSSNQNITNVGGETMFNLVVNNTGTGITLNDPLTITNSITFTDGIVNNNGSDHLIIANTASISGVSNASHVQGTVQKVGNTAFTFPIGDNGVYRPVGISAPANPSDVFTAGYYFESPGLLYSLLNLLNVNNVSTIEYWDLNRNVGSSSVAVTLSWNTNSGDIGDLSDLLVAHWTGTEWESLGQASVTGDFNNGTITSPPVSSFSPFTLGSSSWSNPLPVTWIDVSAAAEQRSARVSWSTATERNNAMFEVERSEDGEVFKRIGVVMSKATNQGNSKGRLDYAFVDESPVYGYNYYRIRQVDFNGENDLSKTVDAYFAHATSSEVQNVLCVYNKANNEIQLSTSQTFNATNCQVSIYNLSGSLVAQGRAEQASNGMFKFKLTDSIPTGVYLVQYALGSENPAVCKIFVP